MDFIFGQSDQELHKSRVKEKQLRTQIILKQEQKRPKQLQKKVKQVSNLSKLKLDGNKKLDVADNISKSALIQLSDLSSVKQASTADKDIAVNKLLQGQLQTSQRGLKFLDIKLIGDSLAQKGDLVYNAQSSQQPINYLKAAYRNIYPDNQFIKNQVHQALNKVVSNVSQLIQSPERINKKYNIDKKRVPKTKDDLKQFQRIDKYRLMKIKYGQVKYKVGDLRNELQKQYLQNKQKFTLNSLTPVDSNYYSMDHPHTKKAQNLIRQLQQKRKVQNRRFKQHVQHKQAQKERILEIQQEYQQELKQREKSKLKQFYEHKSQEREQEREQLRRKQEQFGQWIKMYQRQKPLQQKLQEQMIRRLIIPQIQDRHKKLMKIKAQNRPIDIEDINQHQHRYMDYKRDELIRHKAHLQAKSQHDQMNEEQVSRYYKGKYRYLALQSMYEEGHQTDPKEIERSKKQRQLAYSDQIRYVHQSLTKTKPHHPEDTRKLLRRVRNHNGSASVDGQTTRTIQVQRLSEPENILADSQTLDPKVDGLKNLQYVKSHIRQKLRSGLEKKPKIQLIEIRQHHSYLQQLKEQRKMNSERNRQKPRTYEQKMKKQRVLSSKGRNERDQLPTASQLESMKAKVQNLDQRIKRKQFKQKHNKGRQGLMDSQIQDEYFESINAKIRLVQQLK